MNNCKINLC